MPRQHTSHFSVEFGDCDPAQIVYFPNFFRWVDAASRRFFIACGVPSWQVSEAERGIIGTPVVHTESRFVMPATYGDELEIDTRIAEWRGKSFLMNHRIRRGTDLLVEVNEVRVFVRRVDGDRHRIQAVPVPADWRALCE
jgi:4-hydroxybenzoyl-CoA thioesterase